jgi:hypothetical protein
MTEYLPYFLLGVLGLALLYVALRGIQRLAAAYIRHKLPQAFPDQPDITPELELEEPLLLGEPSQADVTRAVAGITRTFMLNNAVTPEELLEEFGEVQNRLGGQPPTPEGMVTLRRTVDALVKKRRMAGSMSSRAARRRVQNGKL